MEKIAFRLTDNLDPEERLEEAALFKAMSDHYGRYSVLAFKGDRCPDPELPVFGRNQPAYVGNANPVSPRLDYWDDPSFLRHAGREFHLAPLEQAEDLAERMLSEGRSVFVKSSLQKHFKITLRPGDRFRAKIGDMAYSFIDGPPLLVQEFVPIEYEYRFFVADREIVTSSPNAEHLTPIDFPLPYGAVYRTPTSYQPEHRPDIVDALGGLAEAVAAGMDNPHACVDLAMIAGRPGIVEFNPMQLGHLGLFACDVRALARASETLVSEYKPSPVRIAALADEAPFLD